MVMVPAASALPQYAQQTGLACGKCHVDPNGGGTRTAFGNAFKANGHKLPATTVAPATPVSKPVATKPVSKPVAAKPASKPVAPAKKPTIQATKPTIPVTINPKQPVIVVKPPIIVVQPTKDSDELNENDDNSKVGKSAKSETEKRTKGHKRKHIKY